MLQLKAMLIRTPKSYSVHFYPVCHSISKRFCSSTFSAANLQNSTSRMSRRHVERVKYQKRLQEQAGNTKQLKKLRWKESPLNWMVELNAVSLRLASCNTNSQCRIPPAKLLQCLVDQSFSIADKGDKETDESSPNESVNLEKKTEISKVDDEEVPEITSQVDEFQVPHITSNNSVLASNGFDKLCSTINTIVKKEIFPLLPESGVNAVAEYLCRSEQLATIIQSLGAEDLIIMDDGHELTNDIIATCSCALLQMITQQSSAGDCYDFITKYAKKILFGRDILTIWSIEDPASTLQSICEHNAIGYTARLISKSGQSHILSTYTVAIYTTSSDEATARKNEPDMIMIASGSGENELTAYRHACCDAIRHLCHLNPSQL